MVNIYDVIPTTLQDFPDRPACMVFLSGCNLRCNFCHNPAVVSSKDKRSVSDKVDNTKRWTEEGFLEFLKKKEGRLEGVVITGGEPTIYSDLPRFIQRVRFSGFRESGFAIKLDTNGTNPEMLKTLIKNRYLDYIAMDMKAPKEKFDSITKSKRLFKKVVRSSELIKKSNTDHEFRTTVIPELTTDDLIKIYGMIEDGDRYFLQSYSESVTLHPQKHLEIYSHDQLNKKVEILKRSVKGGCPIYTR